MLQRLIPRLLAHFIRLSYLQHLIINCIFGFIITVIVLSIFTVYRNSANTISPPPAACPSLASNCPPRTRSSCSPTVMLSLSPYSCTISLTATTSLLSRLVCLDVTADYRNSENKTHYVFLNLV